MRYWLYKNSTQGGPAGYWGDWLADVFAFKRTTEWGGHHSTRSNVSRAHLDHDIEKGDVVVCYQTDSQEVVGFCVVTKVDGPQGDRKLLLKPIERLATPFKIHRHKAGTSLADSWSVRAPMMLTELTKENMTDLLALTGAPKRLLKGAPAPGGYRP